MLKAVALFALAIALEAGFLLHAATQLTPAEVRAAEARAAQERTQTVTLALAPAPAHVPCAVDALAGDR
jgi:hypothetical protein